MIDTTGSRRSFLHALAAIGVGGPVASRFGAVATTFERRLGALRFEGDADSAERLRDDYLLAPDVLYLNHASIGTVPAPVHEAHRSSLRLCEENPWLYMWGGAWEAARESVRDELGAVLGCAGEDVAITHNTTEGFNLLANGLELGRGDEVLFSSLNHDGASVSWRHLAESRGFTVRTITFPATRAAELGTDDVLALHAGEIRPATRVLVFPHVDNSVGVRHPLQRLTQLAHDMGVEVVAVDGAQTVGMLPLEVEASGVDMYAGSPHKWLQAPKGLGVLYLRRSLRERLRPMWVTWGQQRWAGTVRVFEDYGTRNLPAVLALGAALEYQRALGEEAKQNRYRAMHDLMRQVVDASPGLRWSSPTAWEQGASLVAVEVTGATSADVSRSLYERDGLVVRAFGPPLNAIRLSPNVATTDAQIERALALMAGEARVR